MEWIGEEDADGGEEVHTNIGNACFGFGSDSNTITTTVN